MKITVIEKLMQLLEESSITELEWSSQEDTLKLKKEVNQMIAPPNIAPVSPGFMIPAPVTAVVSQEGGSSKEDDKHVEDTKKMDDLYELTSPMVGSFYASPSPDKPVFVEVGTQVKKGDTLCIIEAMKLMNEIEVEVDGTVQEVYFKDGEPVEYGSVLFLIKKK